MASSNGHPTPLTLDGNPNNINTSSCPIKNCSRTGNTDNFGMNSQATSSNAYSNNTFVSQQQPPQTSSRSNIFAEHQYPGTSK